jgi:hypothetical protein
MPELPRHTPPRRPRNWWISIRDAGFTGSIFLGAIGLVLLWLLVMGAQLALTFVVGALGL